MSRLARVVLSCVVALVLCGAASTAARAARVEPAGLVAKTLALPDGVEMAYAVEINRKYAPSFEAILMDGVGHYPQVERPAEFQSHLRRVVGELAGGAAGR